MTCARRLVAREGQPDASRMCADRRACAIAQRRRSARARERMDRIAESDAVSHDVLIDVVRALEHQQWMLRAQLIDRA
jgi:hypothetical protein